MTTTTVNDMKIHVSRDYDKFSFLGGNRKINKSNYKKLLKSMREEQLIIPIIVNENFEIIDGQHRFTAEKELQLPVYYIINNGYSIDQVKRANTVGLNWTKEDFLQTYIDEENQNYIEIYELRKETKLNINVILKIFGAFQRKAEYFVTDNFKAGTFTVGDDLAGVRFFCQQLEMFSRFKDYKKNAFISAFLKLYLYEEYDEQVMEKQAKWITNFNPKGKTQEQILEDFCKQVYSYRLTRGQILYSKEHKVFFTI